jgi:hypothetical protein
MGSVVVSSTVLGLMLKYMDIIWTISKRLVEITWDCRISGPPEFPERPRMVLRDSRPVGDAPSSQLWPRQENGYRYRVAVLLAPPPNVGRVNQNRP